MSIIAVEEKSSPTLGNNQRCFITELPEEIILLIAAFLHSSKYQNERTFEFSLDWRNFIASNQKYFTPLKKRTRLLHLTREMSTKFHDSISFRDQVLSIVEDPKLQISLSVGKCENPFDACLGQVKYLRIERSEVVALPFEAEEITFSGCKLSSKTIGCASTKRLNVFHTVGCDLLQFPNVEKLCVMEGYNSSPQAYHFLPNLKTVEVTGSDLSDVSCFRDVRKLTLQYCPNVVDVGCLENVHDLTLFCPSITDTSKLGRVRILNISGCPGITDISTLTKVEQLSMSQCPRLSKNNNQKTLDILESLDTLAELNFAYCSLTSAPRLKNVVILDLSYSQYLHDVSALDGSAVEELKLICCPNLSDITRLHSIRVLDISDSLGITDLSGLWAVKKLTMGTSEPPRFFITEGLETFQQLRYLAMGIVQNHQELIPHLKHAPDLKELVLTYTEFNFSELTQVESLTLNHCSDLVSVPASLRSLRSLTIYECENFTTLSELPSLGVLRIWNCDSLRVLTLEGTETSSFPIYSVELGYCANLEEIRVQRRVCCMGSNTVSPLLITNEHLVDH
jgi:hypothetical protein